MNRSVLALLLSLPLVLGATEGWDNHVPEKTQTALPALWQENFDSGTMSGFDVEYLEGAQGSVEIVPEGGYGNSPALKITKTNSVGTIAVTPKNVPSFSAGAQLRNYVSVRGLSGNPDYALAVTRLRDAAGFDVPRKKLTADFAGGIRMTNLVQASPGRWQKKSCQQQVNADSGTKLTPVILVAGAPSVSLWDNWGVEDYRKAAEGWKRYQAEHQPPDFTADRISGEDFDRALAGDREHTAQVVSVNGENQLLIDGVPSAPVLFRSAGRTVSGKNTFAGRTMQEAGVRLQCLTVRLGALGKIGGPYAKGYWSPDGFDVTGAADALRSQMCAAEKSCFVLSIDLSAYPEFSEEHPEEVWRLEDGRPMYGSYVHALDPRTEKIPKYYWPWINYHSLVWCQAVKDRIAELVAELRRTGLSKRIVGIHIAGYHDGQFSVPYPDYSKPAQAAFRRYLAGKYKSDQALQKAWNRDDVTLENAEPPRFDGGALLLPGRDQAQIDFQRFLKQEPFHIQEDFVRFAKKCFGKPMIALRWCQGQFSGYFVAAYDITPFLFSKDFDILVAQQAYERRTPGMPCGLAVPLESFRRCGKIFLNEFDLRTYAVAYGTEYYQLWCSYAEDFPMWQSINRRMAGQMIAERQGFWYYDMSGGWFSPPEIAGDIRETLDVFRKMQDTGKDPWKPSAAFVIDESGLLLRNFPKFREFYEEHKIIGDQIHFLTGSAVPFHVLLMEDLLRDPAAANGYKVLVFAGMYEIDDARKKLVEGLKNSGRTLVFLAGSGRAGGSEVTGFDVRLADGETMFGAPSSGEHYNRLYGVTNQKGREIVAEPGEVNMLGGLHNLIYYYLKHPGKITLPARFFVPETESVRVHARYRSDGAPAVVSRQEKDFRLVYICDPGGLTPEFFNQLVQTAGGYVPADPGLQVNMNGNFLSIHCVQGGKYRFQLPFSAQVKNLKNGHMEPVGEDLSLPLDVTAGETCWFQLIRNP